MMEPEEEELKCAAATPNLDIVMMVFACHAGTRRETETETTTTTYFEKLQEEEITIGKNTYNTRNKYAHAFSHALTTLPFSLLSFLSFPFSLAKNLILTLLN